MLKWKANEGERMLSRTKVPGPPNSVPATPGDIIACLKANPEACAEVTEALHGHWKASALAYRDERDAANARAERAEQALATVTAERDEAKYWLAAHKAASEALVDPVTGHGFFMLIGKGDDGADGWFYTFGGPLDSYTLCERSDDQDPHFVYFQRERYDHDRGCWIDGCEVVESVLAPDECSVAPYCLEDVTEERDTLKRERDEARAEGGAALAWQLRKAERDLDEARATNRDNLAMWEVERDALKAKLAEVERQRDAEVNAHDKLDDLAVAYARERDEARATASNYLERWNAEVERLRETLDTVIAREGSLKAKLAEAERLLCDARDERDEARAERAMGLVSKTDFPSAGREWDALRSRLARYEAVVAEMRVRRDWLDGQCRSVGADSERRRGHVEVYETMLRWIDAALRALDEDSGGSGAAQAGGQSPPPARATGESAQSQGRQLGATQRAAGANDEPPLRELRSEAHRRACEQAAEQLAGSDSPVGVAATAEADIDRLVAARTGEGRHMVTRAELDELRREVDDIRRNLRYITGFMPEAG